MRKNFLLCLLVLALAGFTTMACKDGGPTGPGPLPNAFKITDLEYTVWKGFNYWVVDCWIRAQYTNNTNSKATVTGVAKFWYSPTAYDTVILDPGSNRPQPDIPAGPNASGSWKSDMVGRSYYEPGTYTVEVELTAQFSNGAIKSTFSKQITVQ